MPSAAAALEIADVSIEEATIEPGERASVTVVVRNNGDAAGGLVLRLETDTETELAREEVQVPAGGEVETTLTTEPAPEPMETGLRLNGEEIGTLTVEPDRSRLFVGPDGSDENPGTEEEPLETIQHAVEAVDPGGTVHVLPGEYRQFVGIDDDSPGEPGNPITLTGPPDAILKPPERMSNAIAIFSSHFHLTGLTIDGLLDEENPDVPESYNDPQLIGISPRDPDPQDPHYVEDIVISPHRMGNCGSAFVNAALLKDAEIGGFEVIGPAGASWILDDTPGHNGEFVYLGTASQNLERNQEIEVYDRTRNVRVHHIDNSAGHPHAEMVDCKIGTRNITVEYCTDGGGAQTHEGPYQRSISLDGESCTVRWNVIRNPEGDPIRIGPQGFLSALNAENEWEVEYALDALPETDFERRMGKDHAIYGNVFTGYTHDAVDFLRMSNRPGRDSNPKPADQRVLCGNLYDAFTDDAPGKDCPADLPSGEGVGHLGGDSPWNGDAPTKREAFDRHANARHLDVTVETETIPTNTDIEIPVTVTNDGDESDEVVFRLRIMEHVLAEETVTVPAGEERRLTLTEGGLPDPGEMAVTRNGQKIASVQLVEDE